MHRINQLNMMVEVEKCFWSTVWSQDTSKIERRFYKTARRSAILYGSKCWTIKKCHVQKNSAAEMRMLSWMMTMN